MVLEFFASWSGTLTASVHRPRPPLRQRSWVGGGRGDAAVLSAVMGGGQTQVTVCVCGGGG